MADSRLLRRLSRRARLPVLLLLLLLLQLSQQLLWSFNHRPILPRLLLIRLRLFLLFRLLYFGGYFAACLFWALVVLDFRHRLQGLVAHHIRRRPAWLLRGRLRPTGSRHQYYFLERARISWRPKHHVFVLLYVQQLFIYEMSSDRRA